MKETVMKKMLTALLICVMGAALCDVARAADPTDAVKERVAAFVAAWNQHDAKAMAACWAEDGDLINPFGRVAEGREEVEKLFTDEHGAVMKQSTNEMKVESARTVGDVALADVDCRITGMHDAEGKELPEMKLHVYLVMKEKDGKWIIEAARPYAYREQPGAGADAGK
jgi:uncharacterized protein (TIGR02246 family)